MKVSYRLYYPAVNRQFPDPSDVLRVHYGALEVGCGTWKSNTSMREGFCERIFAGTNGGSGREFPWFLEAKCRSMSVGDLVLLDPDGLNEWWLCDGCGWIRLSENQVQRWLDYPRKYGCCSFEIKEWMDTETAS